MRVHDRINPQQAIGSTPIQAKPWGCAYSYNAAGQRYRVDCADGSYWIYGYDTAGQLRRANKFWSDHTTVAGQQFYYDYDGSGNRTNSYRGQPGEGQTHYSINELNQIAWRSGDAYADILGVAPETAAVTVEEGTSSFLAGRHGDYFHKQLVFPFSDIPIYPLIRVKSSDAISPIKEGHVLLPQTMQSPTYDAQGNPTYDGTWMYNWDGQGRLAAMQTSFNFTGPMSRVEFAYDALGRRIQKKVYKNYTCIATNLMVYDGWNLIAEFDGASRALVRNYGWGLDLSGTMQGAGGIGGLLWVQVPGSAAHFPVFDGNGNVMGLVSGADGTASAHYEYGPFGEVIRQTGPMAKLNPFRFSTKYTDEETELVYYGYRYYSPTLGRWLSRDPIEEAGGLNLYGFVGNNPVNQVDEYGLSTRGSISVKINEPSAGFGYAGWSIRLRWTPPREWTGPCIPCNRAVWVQEYSKVLTTTSLGLPAFDSEGWVKDWDETDYVGNSELWESEKWPRGHRLDFIDAWDDPGIGSENLTWHRTRTIEFNAMTCVKCISGSEAGEIYGCVLWGYKYDAFSSIRPSKRVTGGVKLIWVK